MMPVMYMTGIVVMIMAATRSAFIAYIFYYVYNVDNRYYVHNVGNR